MQLQLSQSEPQEIMPNRFITLAEQRDFCDFLANFQVNPERLAKMRWCASEWERYHCSADHTHTINRKYLNCGLRGECPRCSMSYAHQRAEIMYQWIKRNLADKLDFDLKINQITLTLPEELHELDQKVFAKMIKSFMKIQGIEAFGYVIQTRHSENPLDKKYHHAHVLTLNIKKNNQALEQNDYYFDLDLMRQNWKNTIERFTKISIDGNVNLHNEYASILRQKPTVMHLLVYVYRYSIQDLFEVQVRVRSINYLEFPQFEGASLPKHILQIEDIDSKISEILNESKNNFVWCGLLSSIRREELKRLISGYSSQLDLEGNEITPIYCDWHTLEQIKKEIFERAKTCRDCGFLYEEIPFERGFYDCDDEPHHFTVTIPCIQG